MRMGPQNVLPAIQSDAAGRAKQGTARVLMLLAAAATSPRGLLLEALKPIPVLATTIAAAPTTTVTTTRRPVILNGQVQVAQR